MAVVASARVIQVKNAELFRTHSSNYRFLNIKLPVNSSINCYACVLECYRFIFNLTSTSYKVLAL